MKGNSSQFNVGDVVKLKSGSCDMVVVGPRKDLTLVSWYENGIVMNQELWNVALSKVEPPVKASGADSNGHAFIYSFLNGNSPSELAELVLSYIHENCIGISYERGLTEFFRYASDKSDHETWI